MNDSNHFSAVAFWDSFKRWRLAQKGLSSGKKRRVYADDGGLRVWLSTTRWIHWLFCVLFILAYVAMVLSAGTVSEFAVEPMRAALGAAVLAVTALMMLRTNHSDLISRNRVLLLLLGGVLVHLLILRGVAMWVEAYGMREQYKLLLMPFALAPMVHAILLGRRAGMFSAVFVSVAGVLLVPAHDMVVYLVVSLICGMTAVHLTHAVRKRQQLLRAGLVIGAMALILSLFFGEILVAHSPDQAQSVLSMLKGGIAGFGVGFLTAMIISGLLPFFESFFALTTDISWLELADLNHHLLKQMQLHAPGTFHHSLVVAALAESAAEAIGANAALCRACAYFHDVGKLKKPEYFVENQAEGTENPHDALTPTMSALVIIAHVKDGVDLALKHKLNRRIIDAIQEHHGDSLVLYFWRRAREQRAKELGKIEKGLGHMEDLPVVDEKNFRYPGPRPRTRESGILSLADAIESASRTLLRPSPLKIRGLVDDIVRNRMVDGQLDDCRLSMQELTKVRESFANTLRSMMHQRIQYPAPEESADRKTSGGRMSDERREMRENLKEIEHNKREEPKQEQGDEQSSD